MEELHRCCFGRTGKKTMRKANLRKFSGFGSDVSAKDLERRKAALAKKSVKLVRGVKALLGVKGEGSKVLCGISRWLDG